MGSRVTWVALRYGESTICNGLCIRTSIGALVRRSVQRYLEEEIPVEEDPAMDIIALGSSGLGDLSTEHDRYLAEMEMESNQ